MSAAWRQWILAGLTLAMGETSCLMAGCGPGPEDMTPEQFGQKLAWVERMGEIAKQHGMAVSFNLDLTGRPGVYLVTGGYVDLGAGFRATLLANSATGRDCPPCGVADTPDPPPEPEEDNGPAT